MLKRLPTGDRRDDAARGQVLVVFALSLITLLGFAGLAVDGGSTFAQRRSQQTAADLAALAAANDYLVNGSAALATTRSQSVTPATGSPTAPAGRSLRPRSTPATASECK